MKYDCELIRDIAPLYRDGALGEKSAAIVEEHLRECGQCEKYYESLPSGDDGAPEREAALDPDTAAAADLGRKIGNYKIWQLAVFGCAAAALLAMLPPWFGRQGITEIPGTAALENLFGLGGAALFLFAVLYGFKSRRARGIWGFTGWGMWLFAELYEFITIPMGYVRGYGLGPLRFDLPYFRNFSLQKAFHGALPGFYWGIAALLAVGAVFAVFLRRAAPDIAKKE